MYYNRHNINTKSPAATLPFRGQDFYKLREACLTQRTLFKDPYFKYNPEYTWKRPYEICDDPHIYIDGVSRHDINQGTLGDCWLLAGMSALAMQFDLVRRVIPQDQSFHYQYAGIFHFRLWQFGKWYDVVIDDQLPTDQSGNMCFLHSKAKNEFWTALLEKAYCKMVGGFYKVAEAGNLCEGIEDFTGGVVEQFHVPSAPRNFEQILLKSFTKRSLMGCFMDASPEEIENKRPDGLMKGHSYTITGVININLQPHGRITLIRIRNPWGQVEFNGPWSDGSPEWQNVSDDVKREIGLVYENDGEFWMSYSYFCSNTWDWVDMCHLNPDAYDHDVNKKLDWYMNVFQGSWIKGLSNGSNTNMALNPQVRLTLTEADDEDLDGVCSVLIALLQRAKGPDRFDYNVISVAVYKIDDPQYLQYPLDQYFFQRNMPICQTIDRGTREVAGRFNLAPGNYCLVPFTYDATKDGDFLLRVYTEKTHDMNELDYKIGLKPTDIRMSDVTSEESDESKEVKEVKDNKLKKFFDERTGGDMEADWIELKNILDYAMKNEKSFIHNDKSHFLFDIVSRILHYFSGSSSYHSAFDTVEKGGFPKELCRSMIALLDIDHSGKLNFQEFQDLWTGILKWKTIYETYSKESDGILNSGRLKDALSSAGFDLNKKVLGDLVHRFANKEGNIRFDDFLHCGLKLKSMSDYFKSKEKGNSDVAELTLEEFISKSLYS